MVPACCRCRCQAHGPKGCTGCPVCHCLARARFGSLDRPRDWQRDVDERPLTSEEQRRLDQFYAAIDGN
jgi:hypothetical protein